MAQNTRVSIELESQQAFNSIKDLRAALKRTKDEMVGLESGSRAFLEAANRAAELQHQIEEISESVKGASADFGDMLGNFASAGAGITGAFQAASGALNLMGVESENVAKAIQKMQSVMAITQGLSSIDKGIKSFNKLATAIKVSTRSLGGFKTALVGTGLGALVVVLGSIIANWEEFTEAIGLSSEELDKLGEVWGGVSNVLLNGIKGIGITVVRYVGLIKDTFTSVFSNLGDALESLFSGDFSGVKDAISGLATDMSSSFEKATEGLGEYFDIQANYAAGVQKAITKREEDELAERTKAAEKAAKERAEAEKRAALLAAEARKKAEEQLDIQLEKLKRNGKTERENLGDVIKVESERLKLMTKGTLEYEKQLTKINELGNKLTETPKRDDIDKLIESYRTKEQVISDGQKKEEELLAKSLEQKLITQEEYERLSLEVSKKYTLEYQNLEKEKYADIKSLQDAYRTKEQVIADNEASEMMRLQTAYDNQLIDFEEFERLKTEIAARYAEERVKVESEANLKAEQKREETISSAVQAASMASGLLTDILSTIADEQDTTTKEGFERQKKLQIAAATIQMLTGIATAVSGAYTTKSGPWDFALMAIQAATIAASGAAQIAKIKSQKFDSASSGAASASITQPARALSSPITYTQDVQGADTISAIKDSKVYVVETDITNTQKKVDIAETESTF